MVVERNLGITFGLVVRAMGFSKTVAGGISSLRQGEISQFTVVLEDARRHAIDRMIENAKLLGANWQKTHWFFTAIERDRALGDMSRKHEYSRIGDQPALVFEKVEKLAESRNF